VRRQQSMQLTILEAQLEVLRAENRNLAVLKQEETEKLNALRIEAADSVDEKDDLQNHKKTIEWLNKEIDRLRDVNQGLLATNATLNERSDQQAAQYQSILRKSQQENVANEDKCDNAENLSLPENSVDRTTHDKDLEIEALKLELNSAHSQIRALEVQIRTFGKNDSESIRERDTDYFDIACQTLCRSVEQWIFRFSKFSDKRPCRLTLDITQDRLIERLNGAVLDGSNVNDHLSDRVARRDVMMSMTMSMIWEYIFTRYLFGMDREHRQKLKNLEKLLLEVGPRQAVAQWRAMTISLFMKRPEFVKQREQDTEAVVQVIFDSLSEILPPPTHVAEQLQDQLRRVCDSAVELSLQMRCEPAEYTMLPPLQPEYNAEGGLARKVMFNSALMSVRCGAYQENDPLESGTAVVRMVLFPLVVVDEEQKGPGDGDTVVFPAQVLLARDLSKSGRGRAFSEISAAGSLISQDSNHKTSDISELSYLN
jgi:hypothetical protein